MGEPPPVPLPCWKNLSMVAATLFSFAVTKLYNNIFQLYLNFITC